MQYSVKFQSTHPRRVRRRHSESARIFACFNPRTHVGCDYQIRLFVKLMEGFNPRTHVGCDATMLSSNDTNDTFQSTHPRRVRQFEGYDTTYRIGFNPRTHVGCDLTPCVHLSDSAKFQSTHPRRVRRAPCCRTRRDREFQSTHPRRVRQERTQRTITLD